MTQEKPLVDEEALKEQESCCPALQIGLATLWETRENIPETPDCDCINAHAKEFFRREAHWARKLNLVDERPLVDLAKILNGPQLSDECWRQFVA